MRLFTWFALLLFGAASLAAASHDPWIKHVPDKARLRRNPFVGNADAVAAGSKLFRQHCAACHGSDAEGSKRKPPLRSGRIKKALPGELEWLLRNGCQRNGMPSWSHLPEQQRWQIVTYLKSIQ